MRQLGGVAVVHGTALADFLVILLLCCLHDKPDVHNLGLADLPVSDAVQRTAAALAVVRLVHDNPVRHADSLKRTALVAGLSAARLPARLAQGPHPALLTGCYAFPGRGYAAIAAVLLRLSGSARRTVISIATLKFLDAGFGFGEFLLRRGKFRLQTVYLLVFTVNDTVEPSNLLGLLGVRLLKLTQTLVDQA